MTGEKAVIYHNPRCTKSRKTHNLLEEHNFVIEVVEYLKNPPKKKEIIAILKMLGLGDPRDLMRKKEKEYTDQNLDDPNLTMDALVNTMIQYPILIERPIVIINGKAAIGRPPENILAII